MACRACRCCLRASTGCTSPNRPAHERARGPLADLHELRPRDDARKAFRRKHAKAPNPLAVKKKKKKAKPQQQPQQQPGRQHGASNAAAAAAAAAATAAKRKRRRKRAAEAGAGAAAAAGGDSS
jgi:hypothetical protein